LKKQARAAAAGGWARCHGWLEWRNHGLPSLVKGIVKLFEEIATNDRIVVQAIIACTTLENISHQSNWMKKVDNQSTLM